MRNCVMKKENLWQSLAKYFGRASLLCQHQSTISTISPKSKSPVPSSYVHQFSTTTTTYRCQWRCSRCSVTFAWLHCQVGKPPLRPPFIKPLPHMWVMQPTAAHPLHLLPDKLPVAMTFVCWSVCLCFMSIVATTFAQHKQKQKAPFALLNPTRLLLFCIEFLFASCKM